jgi:xylulokinase
MFLPYLAGERTPHDDPHARGVFFGLSNASTRVDCVRAVMEGVALTFADARECVEEGETPLGAVGLTGGGAKSALWTRLIAAALERTIVRYRDSDVGPALGAARLARLAATGEAPEAVCAPPAVLDETAPEPALVDRLRPRISRFRSLYQAIAPQFAAAGKPEPFDFG